MIIQKLLMTLTSQMSLLMGKVKRNPKVFPNLPYGRFLKKSLRKADVDTENQHVLPLDRDNWRDDINKIFQYMSSVYIRFKFLFISNLVFNLVFLTFILDLFFLRCDLHLVKPIPFQSVCLSSLRLQRLKVKFLVDFFLRCSSNGSR